MEQLVAEKWFTHGRGLASYVPKLFSFSVWLSVLLAIPVYMGAKHRDDILHSADKGGSDLKPVSIDNPFSTFLRRHRL